MAQTRVYDPSWIGVWRDDTNGYVGGSNPIMVGGSQGYNSYIGFPSQIRTAINDSSIPVTIKVSFYVSDAAEFDVGAHNTTKNPAKNGLPWYEYIGLHPTLSTGRRTVDITSPFKSNFMSGAYEGIVLYGPRGSNYGRAYGISGNSYRFKIELTGQWNSPPTKPIVTYPNGGETISGKVTLKASPATDPDEPQSKLRYQWSIYDGSWKDLPLGKPGVTSLDVDFAKYRETNKAQVRVRAFDSYEAYDRGNYSPWDYSNGVFTIRHNLPPTAPTELKPIGGRSIDRTEIIEFSWRHNDADNQSKYSIRWRVRGEITWRSTITKTSTTSKHYFNGNTFPVGMIEWQVQTFDQGQLASPWSAIALFNSVDPTNAPIIVSPTGSEDITIINPILEWSSIDQQEYQYEVLSGDVVVFTDSEISENKAVTLGYALENNTDYTIRLRVKATTGLWSEWTSVNIHTNFTPPPEPQFGYEADSTNGSVTLTIVNPLSEGDQPDILNNDVYRRLVNGGDWELIGQGIEENGVFTDYMPASGKEYEYKIVANGVNETTSESAPTVIFVSFLDVLINIVSNPQEYIRLIYNPSKSFTHSVDVEVVDFKGRTRPMAEFSENDKLDVSLSFTLRSYEEVERMLSVMERRETLLYRDSRGRKEYIVIPQIQVTDKKQSYEISFSPVRVYYREGQI